MGQITLIFNSTQTDTTFSNIDFTVDINNTNVLISNNLVTNIPASFMLDQVDLVKVTFTSGITNISGSAFKGCTNLEEILLGDVASISESVFEGCTKIPYIKIPDSVTTLSNSLFKGCTSLTSVEYSEFTTSFGNNVFENCTSLQSFTINKNVTTLGNSVFKNDGLLNLVIPDSVTFVGEGLLENCLYLTSVTIGASVATINNNLFKGCSVLNTVNISNSVTIGTSAFENCASLTDIYIPLSITTIGASSFKNSGIVNFIVPLGVTTIGANAFESCISLSSLIISYNVNTIGSSAFLNCSNLTEVEIPSGVSVINSYLFSGCTKLSTVYISNTVSSIQNNAFNDCTSIYNITIPDSVTTIENNAFNGCINLGSIRLHSNVVSVGSYAFNNCSSMKNVTILSNSTTLSTTTFNGCSGLAKAYINYPANNNALLQYFHTNYQNVVVYFIPVDVSVNIEIPITLQLETAVETYAEIMHSDKYDFLLEEQKVLDGSGTYKVSLVSMDVLRATLRYSQVLDETNFYLTKSENARLSLTQSIDKCNTDNRFMLTENKLLDSMHLTDNTITYPNATVPPKIFSLIEHWISFLASAFFKNPENRGPISNISSIKEQMKNGVDNNTIGGQFLTQVDPEINPLVLRSIFEQMLAQDPDRFTYIDDTIINQYEDLNSGIPIPFKENDTITFNLKVLGNIKTQNSVYNNLYAAPNIKNIKDVFASFPWAQNYYETSVSDNILTIIPKTFKVKCVVGPTLVALNDIPYVDSNKALYIPPTSTDYIYDSTVETMNYDPENTTNNSVWKDNTTFVTDPVIKNDADESSNTAITKVLTNAAKDQISLTHTWKKFAKVSDMLAFVTMYLTIFCATFETLKNASGDDMNEYIDKIYDNEKKKGNTNITKKDIIKINVTKLLNLVKGIITDIRKAITIIINVKISTVKKLLRTVQLIASIISRSCNTVLDIMGFGIISEDNTEFLGSAFTLNYLLASSKKTNVSNDITYYASKYGIVYSTLLKLKLLSDVTTEIIALGPEDQNDSSDVKPVFFPDPIVISRNVKNLISSAKSIKGKKNFPLFMNILEFICCVVSLSATILTPSAFDFNDFLKLIQFNKVERFFSNIITNFSTIIDNGILKLTGVVIDGDFYDVTDGAEDIIDLIKIDLSDIMDDISEIDSFFTNTIKIQDLSIISVGDTFTGAFNALDTELTGLAQSFVDNIKIPTSVVVNGINNTTKKTGGKLKKILRL